MSTADDFAPFRLLDHDEGHTSLLLSEFEPHSAIFEELGYDAGGYAWHGVADALIRMRAKHLRRKVQFDPEASLFAAYGKERAALVELARLLRDAVNDPALLREAIEAADPDLMD